MGVDRNGRRGPLSVLTLALAISASAGLVSARAEERAFCAERPGQTTPPCALERGRLMLETSPLGWSRTKDDLSRTDTVLVGASELRLGLTDAFELQFGWTPLGLQRTRDFVTGGVNHAHGIGDLTVGVLQNFGGGEGPVALQAFATLPTGGAAIGAGDWGAGVRLPVSLNLPHHLQLALTPEADAAVNGSGSGRHLAFGGAAGVAAPLTSSLQFAVDVAAFRDEDPGGHTTRAMASVSLAWQVNPNLQLDVGGLAGLTHDSPSAGLYVGVAARM